MKLGKMLEGAVQDLSWLEQPETYDISKHHKKNDVIRELDIQWGHGSSSVPEETVQPVDVVKPRVVEDETKLVVRTARRLIASGRSGSDVVARLESKFGADTVKGSVPDLREAFELDGVAGCFAVDCRGFANCREAMEHAQKSPYKRFLAFVVNHDCGKDCHRIGRAQKAVTGGSVDGLLSDAQTIVGSDRPFCRTLGLPVLSYDGVAPEFVDKTVIDLMTLGQITEEDAEEIRSMKSSPFKQVREAFRRAARNALRSGRKDYSAKVDASEHKLEATKMDFEMATKLVLAPPQDVDPVDHRADKELALDEDKVLADVDVDPRSSMEDVELGGLMMALDDIDPSGASFGQPVDVTDDVGFVAQSVDRGDGRIADFDVEPELEGQPQQDVCGVCQRVEDIEVDESGAIHGVDPVPESLFDFDVEDAPDRSVLDVSERGAAPEVEILEEIDDLEIDPTGVVDKEFRSGPPVSQGCPVPD